MSDPLPKELSEICLKEGIDIFKELRRKYNKQSIASFDICLNSLICSLLCLGLNHVKRGNEKEFSQLVEKILYLELCSNIDRKDS